MSESDDKLLRRYRALSRDEPPAHVDAAILAASRRAVASRPWSQRFAGPVSIAAVLVLALGVTLNMQHQQPGVELPTEHKYAAAPSAAPEPAVPASPGVTTLTGPVTREVAPEAIKPDAFARKVPAPKAKDALQAQEVPPPPPPKPMPMPMPAPVPETFADSAVKKESAVLAREAGRSEPRAFTAPPADMVAAPQAGARAASSPTAPAPAAPPQPASSPAASAPAAPSQPALSQATPAKAARPAIAESVPAPASTVPATVAPPPAFAPSPPPPARAAAPSGPAPRDPEARTSIKPSGLAASREKREAVESAAPADLAKSALPLPDPAAELERIARLRADGHHDQADKALEAFLRKHPDYRIPDPVWDRVKPR